MPVIQPTRLQLISGNPDNPDISAVHATYDSSGSLSITVDFYNSINSLDTSQNYAFYSKFIVGFPLDPGDPNSFCSQVNPGDLSGQHHVYTAYPFTFFDRASAQGYSGYLNFNRSTSADGRQITISASSPALADRDYRCMTYELDARKHAPASDPLSLYDPDCGCWYRGVTLDSAGGAGIYVPPPTLWFDGFRPAGIPSSRPAIAADTCAASCGSPASVVSVPASLCSATSAPRPRDSIQVQ